MYINSYLWAGWIGTLGAVYRISCFFLVASLKSNLVSGRSVNTVSNIFFFFKYISREVTEITW
jgi:hypothetical protein